MLECAQEYSESIYERRKAFVLIHSELSASSKLDGTIDGWFSGRKRLLNYSKGLSSMSFPVVRTTRTDSEVPIQQRIATSSSTRSTRFRYSLWCESEYRVSWGMPASIQVGSLSIPRSCRNNLLNLKKTLGRKMYTTYKILVHPTAKSIFLWWLEAADGPVSHLITLSSWTYAPEIKI